MVELVEKIDIATAGQRVYIKDQRIEFFDDIDYRIRDKGPAENIFAVAFLPQVRFSINSL
jgi:hypothetical protein